MAKVTTYLNFSGNCEAAFEFYKSVFWGEFEWDIFRLGNMSEQEGIPPLSEADKNLIMFISLPILGWHRLLGSDVPEFMWTVRQGNMNYISLHPDSREQAEELFTKLSTGWEIEMPLEDQFWGDYYGSFTDKYGICWMINYNAEYNTSL